MVPALKNKMTVLLAPASQTAAATRAATVDALGADWVDIEVNCAAEVNTSAIGPTVAIQEANDTNASSFATWSSSFSIAGAADALVAAKQYRFSVDARTRKRYLRLLMTAATHTTNDIVTASAVAILSRREDVPAGTSGLVGSTSDTVVVG